MQSDIHYEISYGKVAVPFYRVYATPLTGITSIPESSFTGRENILFAAEVDVEVLGQNFLPAYTQGDNRQVVATDSMKNFILHHALTFSGSTLEDLLNQFGQQFLTTYPQMHRLHLTARELPFTPASVPAGSPSAASPSVGSPPLQGPVAFSASNVLFKRTHDDFALAEMDFARSNDAVVLTNHRCGQVGLQLFKVTGSGFTRFVHDSYTTLPERSDRPLFIYMDVFWRYSNPATILSADRADYVAPEQIRDLLQVVFHEFVSESIQHLVHEMGQRLLARFPQLSEVSFAAQNRTRDPIAVSETDERIKVYSDPFSAWGIIKLTLRRAETHVANTGVADTCEADIRRTDTGGI